MRGSLKRNTFWALVSGLMALSLILAACTPTAEPTTPTTPTTPTAPTTPSTPTQEKPQQEPATPTVETPQYGGTIRLAMTTDITGWDDVVTRGFTPGPTLLLTNEAMWQGDWAKGPAGGYGTNESDWVDHYDVFDHKGGHVATGWSWSLDEASDSGTLVYKIRQGVRYALNPKSEASKLVNGREMTAEDVVFSLKQMSKDPRSYVYRSNPDLRDAEITKTGDWEVTIKVSKVGALIQAISRFGNYGRVVPPEVVSKYGDMAKWQNSVGTGPFILKDYVPGSSALLDKNTSWWVTDPVGAGKGNKLPYIDTLNLLVIPDVSTRLAALRTGKLDQIPNLTYEDATTMRKTAPKLKEFAGILTGTAQYVYMNTQKKPFDDVRVRRALQMAVDMEAIKKNLNNGEGQIVTWPVEYVKAYEKLYLSPDAPDFPAAAKELFTYNTAKAKELLTEAGYPNGFKAEADIQSSEVDYFSIIKDYWAKVGVELTLNVYEIGTLRTVFNKGQFDVVGTIAGRGPVGIFYNAPTLVGSGAPGGNGSQIDDPVIHEAIAKVRLQAATDLNAAMDTYREMLKYVLPNAYVIQRPIYNTTTFAWPWIKNYSGEQTMGYFVGNFWAAYVWVDQDLKKSMGY